MTIVGFIYKYPRKFVFALNVRKRWEKNVCKYEHYVNKEFPLPEKIPLERKDSHNKEHRDQVCQQPRVVSEK